MCPVKVQVQIETLYFFRAEGRGILLDQTLDIFRGKTEHKVETQRSAFAPDNMQTLFADIFPTGILRQARIAVKESFLDEAVNADCIKCYDLPLYEAETVKSVF